MTHSKTVIDNDLPASNPDFDPPINNPFGLSDVGWSASPTFADIDSDGDLDAFVGGIFGISFYRNTGNASNPAFALPTANPFGIGYSRDSSPTFVDIDNDGDLDGFVGDDYGDTALWLNTGTANSPAFATANYNPFGLSNVGHWDSASPCFADIDDDGDFDAFIGRYNDTYGDNNSLLFFQNMGTADSPVFAAPSYNPFGLRGLDNVDRAKPSFVDIDGDGDLDALIGNITGNIFVQFNTGTVNSPAFDARMTNPFGLSDVGARAAPVFVDINADGDLDAFVGNSDGNTLFYQNFASNPVVSWFGITASEGLTQVEGTGTNKTVILLLRSPARAI